MSHQILCVAENKSEGITEKRGKENTVTSVTLFSGHALVIRISFFSLTANVGRWYTMAHTNSIVVIYSTTYFLSQYWGVCLLATAGLASFSLKSHWELNYVFSSRHNDCCPLRYFLWVKHMQPLLGFPREICWYKQPQQGQVPKSPLMKKFFEIYGEISTCRKQRQLVFCARIAAELLAELVHTEKTSHMRLIEWWVFDSLV